MTLWLIRSTFANKDEAISAARTLLEEKLIACANIEEGMISLYRWEGTTQQENEISFIAKTSSAKVKEAMTRIKSLHSYQIPAIVAWKAGEANETFAEWVEAETK